MTRPYYESDRGVIYHGDCREILAGLARESVDLVVTDPPYGVDWQANTRAEKFQRIVGDASLGEAEELWSSTVPTIIRATRRSRHIYSFGLPVEHPLTPVRAELIWDKGRPGAGDLSLPWGPGHEKIFFCVRAADAANARRESGKLAARMRRNSVLTVPRLNALQVKNHPTEKPVLLLRQLIESSSTWGEVVLDPFAGVHSTGVAALLEGRRYIGIELDERYCEIGAKRLDEAAKLAA